MLAGYVEMTAFISANPLLLGTLQFGMRNDGCQHAHKS